MAMSFETNTRLPAGLFALMALQFVCVVFFLGDVAADYRASAAHSFELHLSVEIVATFSLLAAIVVEGKILLGLVRRKAHLEGRLRVASAAVYDVIEAHFQHWKLSPAETDVATFLVKGLEIAQIAELRGSAEGTVKAHLNAIYRKSGTHSRGELLSVLIDGLLGGTTFDEALDGHQPA